MRIDRDPGTDTLREPVALDSVHLLAEILSNATLDSRSASP